MAKIKTTNNDLQNITQKTRDPHKDWLKINFFLKPPILTCKTTEPAYWSIPIYYRSLI